MTVWDSNTYRDDIKNALKQLDIEAFLHKKILITGASGLIGSALVDLLLCANQECDADITIYAAGRSIKKLEDRFSYTTDKRMHLVCYDATKELSFGFYVDFIIHGASNASPDKYVNEPVDTLLANILGVHNLLKYALDNQSQKFVYISSSEVYGTINSNEPLKEDVYGNVDVLSVRSSYAMGKRSAENLTIGYARQYGLQVSIVRPGHIYGPTSQNTDNRVSSSFAVQASQGNDIVMKSLGLQLRSYCHCIDCATAIMTVLTRGENLEAYNISNRNSVITIRKMAEIIAKYAGVRLCMDVPTDVEKSAFNPMSNSSLDSTKLEAIGWKGQFDAEKGFEHTIAVLREVSGDKM